MARYGKDDSVNNKNTSTVGELSKAVTMLKDAANGFLNAANIIDDAVNELTGNNSKDVKDRVKNNKEVLSKLEGISKQHITKTQAMQGALVSSLERVATYAINQFTAASGRIISNYNASLEAITVRQQMSNKEYTDALNASTKWIKENGLKVQFSEVDFTNALQGVLSTGLRDIGSSIETQFATNMAQQNLITNKLLPQLSTNTRTYTRASKLLGDSLSQNITAIGKYTEKIYGAEGLEENQVNNFMETILRDVLYAGTQQGWTKEQASKQVGDMLGTYQWLANSASSYVAEEALGALKGLLEGDMTNVTALSSLGGTGIVPGQNATLTAQGASQFMKNYYQNLLDEGKVGPGAMANMAGIGSSSTAIMEATNSKYYGQGLTEWMDIAKSIDVGSLYKEQVGSLQEGRYQTAEGKIQKWTENTVAGVSNTIAQYIPQDALSSINGIVSDWFSAWKKYEAADTLINGATNLIGGGKGGTLLKGGLKLLGKTGALKAGSTLAQTAVNTVGANLMEGGATLGGVFNTSMPLAIGTGIAGTLAGGAMAFKGGSDVIKDIKRGDVGGGTLLSGIGAVGGTVGALGMLGALGAASGPIGWAALAIGGVALLGRKAYDVADKFGGIGESLDSQEKDFKEMLSNSSHTLTEQEEILKKYKDSHKEMGKEWEDELKHQRSLTKGHSDYLFDKYGITKGSAAAKNSEAGQAIYEDLMARADTISNPEKKQAYLDAVEAAFSSWGGISRSEYEGIVSGAGTSARAWFRSLFSTKIDDKSSWAKSLGIEDLEAYEQFTGRNTGIMSEEEARSQAGYAVGSDFITGKQNATLHRGEAILTSSTASKLRQLANGQSLSGFIDSLYNANVNTSALPESTTVSFDPIVEAIQEQTSELKESLIEIITLISSVISPTGNASIDYRLINYQGAGGYR